MIALARIRCYYTTAYLASPKGKALAVGVQSSRCPAMKRPEPLSSAYNDALTRHRAAVKRLTEIGNMISRLKGAKLAAENWKISSNEFDLRRDGGILCGDGNPIMPHAWPTFDQVADAIKERDAALAQLKELGLNPADWK